MPLTAYTVGSINVSGIVKTKRVEIVVAAIWHKSARQLKLCFVSVILKG